MLSHQKFEEVGFYSVFDNKTGTKEYFITLGSNSNEINVASQLEELNHQYKTLMKSEGLSDSTLIFTRIYVSDVANQEAELRESELFSFSKRGAYCVVEQSPLGQSGKVAIFCYHLLDSSHPVDKKIISFEPGMSANGIEVLGKNYSQTWIGNSVGLKATHSEQQTGKIFSDLESYLKSKCMNMLDNLVRTWIYVRDVDNNYAGVVKARRERFEKSGLTPETRYIASTGIEGKPGGSVSNLVSMDSLVVSGLKQKQIKRMEALDHLCPTHHYGVTFERGTSVQYGDRVHLYISGTASIDHTGKVLFLGDVVSQVERTFLNINALLAAQNATLKDMAYFFVYVRDVKDSGKVLKAVQDKVGKNVPVILLQGAVCRPEWLVEIEGVAVKSERNDFPEFL